MVLKYPNCKICKALRKELPSDVIDKTINDYHESKGSYELFPMRYRDIVVDVILKSSDSN